jgi:hypothetical protein
MLVEYIVELINKWENEGVSEDKMVERILNRWDFDETHVRGIINYGK